MVDRLRSNGLAQWTLTLMPVVPVLSLLAEYHSLWVVLVAYLLGTYPIFETVIGEALRGAPKTATAFVPMPSETPGTA